MGRLELWSTGKDGWVEITAGAGSFDAPASFEAELDQARAWHRLFTGARELNLRFRPTAGRGNGPGESRLSIDDLDVIVDHDLASLEQRGDQ